MAKFLNKSSAVAFFYTVALLAISFYRDKNFQPGLLVQVPELLALHINADPKTFAAAGLEMSKTGWLSQSSIWILHLWPPGFVMLLAAIFALGGASAPYLLVLLVLSIAMAVTMSMVIRRYLQAYVSDSWALILPLLPFAFPVTRFFLLQPLGLAFGEGFSVMFFITACFLLLLGFGRNSARLAVVAGVMLALAAYFRSQYELLVASLCVMAVAFALWLAVRRVLIGKSDFLTSRAHWFIWIALIVAQLSMLPWRINNYIDVGSVGWVQTSEIVARNGLASDQKLNEIGGGFVLIGGGNLACKFEPTYCDKTDPALFYQAFFQNIPAWLTYKASLAGSFWFPSLSFFPRPVDAKVPAEYLANGFVIFLIPVIIFFLYASRRSREFYIHSWLLMSFGVCFFAIFALVQFEVRYFFFVKIFILFMSISLGAVAWSAWRAHALNKENFKSKKIVNNEGE